MRTHTIQLLNLALDEARRKGYEIRREWLDGEGGGACEIRGRRFFFLDLAQEPSESLRQILAELDMQPRELISG